MIDNKMENAFKADLNGWLEHESKYPSIADSNKRKRIYENFESTMKFFGATEQAREALHNVIFHALVHQEDYENDFDVPRFENGIDYDDYVDLIHDYHLFTFTKRELWKMDVEHALEFLFKIYFDINEPYSTIHKTFISLSLQLIDDNKYILWTNLWREEIEESVTPSTLYILIEVFYECINNAIQVSEFQNIGNRIERLFDSLHKLIITIPPKYDINTFNILYAIVEMAKENGIQEAYDIESYCNSFTSYLPTIQMNLFEYDIEEDLTSNKPNSTPITLIEYLKTSTKDPELSNHEQIFKTILNYINRETIPNQRDLDCTLDAETSEFDRLECHVMQNYPENRAAIRRKCIYIIRNQGMYWKSVLKVMIQFMDLWISDVIDSECLEIFAKLIVKDNMLPVLYKHILKHVEHYNLNDDSTSMEMIKKISRLLEKCIIHIQTNQELLLFRDFVFNNRHKNDHIRSPILGSVSFWNIPFEEHMLKVTNQITSFEEDTQVPENVIKELIILSIIWPYEVVRQLFITCIQNKNLYKAIVPVLINLGNLCTLNSQKNCPDTLLVLVLKDTLSPQNSELVAKNMTSIVQFIKTCCLQKEFDHRYALILTPSSLSDRKLLSVKEVINNFVLENLTSFFENDLDDHVVLLQFALHLLSVFCDNSSTEDWRTMISKSDLPAFLYCSPETLLLCLTKILDLRLLDGSEQVLLKLQDWELALNTIKKISIIIQYVMETCIEQFPLIYQFFEETLAEFDWKTQLLWYDITQYIFKHPLRIPTAFFRITGGLNELFVEDSNHTMVQVPAEIGGWVEVFTACKLSTKITDNLFEQADRWMYNLLLLWNHPCEDTIVRASLEYVLHPKTSLSVSIEYLNLLLHFLNKLYDSFIDVDQVIRNYEGYERQEMIPVIQDLSKSGTRQYFIVLYIILLLKDNIKKSQEDEDKQDNYYVSNLIKLLQNFTNWGNISQATASYNELKSKMKTNPISSPVHDNDTNTESSSADTDLKIVYYPLLDTEELKSSRALSVVTLYHLCSLFQDKVLGSIQQQAIERLMLQITEGLIDMPSRQNFQRMLQQQPKSRVTNWKKKKSDSKFVMLIRPTLTSNEAKLLRPVVVENVPNNERMVEALGLSLPKNEEVAHTGPKMRQYLYFIN